MVEDPKLKFGSLFDPILELPVNPLSVKTHHLNLKMPLLTRQLVGRLWDWL